MFGSGRQVAVDSVAYNLAGAEENRPDYLKSLVVGNVLSGTKDSISQTLKNGYLNGPASKMKQFYRWAERPENYGLIGIPTGKIRQMNAVSSLMVQDAMARIYGFSPWVQRAQIGNADIALFAEQFLITYYPWVLVDQTFTADMLPNGQILVSPSSTAGYVFTPANFDPQGSYVYAWYNEITGGSVSAVTMGDWVDIGGGDFPDLSSWVLESESTSGVFISAVYSKLTYQGSGPLGAIYLRETRYTEDNNGSRRYRTNSQTYQGIDHSQSKMFIYKIGSGDPELDGLLAPPASMGEFFPYIPARINNVFLSKDYYAAEYEQCKKAYRKATGSKFDNLIDKISDNPSLADIDHAYVVFGVSLNVLENASRRYLYRFFERMQQTQVGGPGLYNAWKNAMTTQQSVYQTWLNWKTGQEMGPEDGRYGAPEPPRPIFPQMPGNEIRIGGSQSTLATHFDQRLSWLYITNGTGTGKAKPTAKKGEVWFEVRVPDQTFFSIYGGGTMANVTVGNTVNTVRIYFQETNNRYRYLDLVGMAHHNYVYGYRRVEITAQQAIEDTEESGFVIPLHYDIWDDISLVQGTQMATASVFVIFNCYKIKKAKWYEKGIFQIIFVIAIAIVSVLLTGGAGIGILGAHMTVGATFGLTGIAAAIAGSIVNALAAMILSTLLNKLGTGIFGEQFGALFGFVLGFVLGGGINFDAGSFSINWGELLKVDNLMKLANVAGETIAGSMRAETQAIGVKMADYKDNAKDTSEKIQQAFFDEFGYGAGKIDPMMYVDVASSSRILAESSDTFLTRTLMTGSEVAELSRDLIYNFTDYTTKLPDAYV